MKKYLILLFIALNHLGCINTTYTKQKLKQAPPEISSSKETLSDGEIYSTNWTNLKSYIQRLNTKTNLIVSYTYWCPTSKYSFDEFAKLESDTSVNVVFITPDDWYYIPQYKVYLKSKNYTKPSFILDINQYGNKFNPHPKYKKFFKEVCSGCDTIGGFPSFVILDKNLNVLYAKSGRLDSASLRILERK